VSRTVTGTAGAKRSAGTVAASGSTDLALACGLALATALIHVQAAADHLGESPLYAVLFVAVAAAQIGWAVAAHRRPSQAVLVAGAAMSMAVVCVWALSRTVGLPVGPDRSAPEQPGALDVIATINEVALALLVAVCWARGRRGMGARPWERPRGPARSGRERPCGPARWGRERLGLPAGRCSGHPAQPAQASRARAARPAPSCRGDAGRRLTAVLRAGSLSLILLSSMVLGGGFHAH